MMGAGKYFGNGGDDYQIRRALLKKSGLSQKGSLLSFLCATKKESEPVAHCCVCLLYVCLLKNKVVFKSYTPNQLRMLPPSLEELIEKNHPVRIVNQVINKIDVDPLLKKFRGGGTSSYHPRMHLKVKLQL